MGYNTIEKVRPFLAYDREHSKWNNDITADPQKQYYWERNYKCNVAELYLSQNKIK